MRGKKMEKMPVIFGKSDHVVFWGIIDHNSLLATVVLRQGGLDKQVMKD